MPFAECFEAMNTNSPQQWKVAGKVLLSVGLVFLAFTIAFFVIGLRGLSVFAGVGSSVITFTALGIVFLAKSRRGNQP
jgi:hypothetical protein